MHDFSLYLALLSLNFSLSSLAITSIFLLVFLGVKEPIKSSHFKEIITSAIAAIFSFSMIFANNRLINWLDTHLPNNINSAITTQNIALLVIAQCFVVGLLAYFIFNILSANMGKNVKNFVKN